MIYTIEGKQYNIPAEMINSSKSIFMTKVKNDKVTDEDIAFLEDYVKDELDKTLANSNCVEIQRLLLYFELPDGMITQTPPLGRPDKRLECCMHFATISRDDLARL